MQIPKPELAEQYNAAVALERQLWRQLTALSDRGENDEALMTRWRRSAEAVHVAAKALSENELT